MKKCLAITTVILSFVACGGSTPTAPTAAPANIAGSYATTITAASSCSANLPFAILGFTATVSQNGGSIQTQLSAHAPGTPSGTVTGTVAGQTVTFPNFSLSEAMGRGATLTATGNLTVASGGLKITGTLNGTFQSTFGPLCTSTSHQIELVKLCEQKFDQGTVLTPCAGI